MLRSSPTRCRASETAHHGVAHALGLGLAAAALLGTGAAEARALRIHGEGVELACEQQPPLRLRCDYRLFPAGEPARASATSGPLSLPAPELTPRTEDPEVSAVLFLVDTSDAARQPTVARNRAQVLELMAAGGSHHRFGLAAFAADTRILAPLGAGVEEIRAASEELRAGGRTTELYRNVLEAVRRLGEYPARRRALVLFSDGRADDRAYFHDDVVEAARANGVAIFGLGYAEAEELSVALQRLRRLAEETGGRYVAADEAGALPADFLAAPYAVLDSGGSLELDLAPLATAPRPRDTVRLTWHFDGRRDASAFVPLDLSLILQAPGESMLIAVPAQTSRDAASEPPVPPVRRPGWWVEPLTWAGAALGLLVVALGALHLLRRRRGPAKEPPWAETVKLGARSFAYLELQDEDRTRHPVSSDVYRIGRHADNELVLTDYSISRHHAQISRAQKGRFTIEDLESLNGVYVNGKKCRSKILANGDIIELGDVTLKFTQFAAQEHAPGPGVSESTVTPFRSTAKRNPRPV